MNVTQQKPSLPRQRSVSSTHWKFAISVMGATPKQRSIYINTWIDIKASAKKKQAVRTLYGQYFHIKHASDSISLELYVHDIQNNLEISHIWDSVVLNVIVLPFNHSSSSVDKPLKQLIRELSHCKVPLRRLFSKSLLICPSNFSSMDHDQFLKQTKRVSEGLLQVIRNGLGPRAKTLNLMPSDIVMMESGRKSSMLPTAKDWRVNATEYVLKYLIFSDRDRKAFIAWILNIPNPLHVESIRFISQRLKNWKTSRRRAKEDTRHTARKDRRGGGGGGGGRHLNAAQQRAYDRRRINIEKGSLNKKQRKAHAQLQQGQRPKLSSIARDFDTNQGLEAAVESEYQRSKRERDVHHTKHVHHTKIPSKYDDEKMDRVDPNLAALLSISDDDSETDLLMLQKINRAAQHKPNDDSKEIIVRAETTKTQTPVSTAKTVTKPTPHIAKKSVKTEEKKSQKKAESVTESEEDASEDTKSDGDSDEEDASEDTEEEDTSAAEDSNDTAEATDSDSEDTDSEEEAESEDDSSDSHRKKPDKKRKRNTKELKRFCKNANLSRYYSKMVAFGFNSSSEFLDLDDKDLDEMIVKLRMVFKDEKQFRKCVNSAKIACGMKEEQLRHEVVNANRLDLAQHDSFSPLSDLEAGDQDEEASVAHFYDAMEPGISKMALIDLDKKCAEFSKINRKCGDSLSTLRKSYRDAQTEMDGVYSEYKKQIDVAHKKAMDLLHTFVCRKQDKIINLQKRMKSAVHAMKACETECNKTYKSGKQDDIAALVNETMRNIKLPSDFTVASGTFAVEFADKLDIFPPILQPDVEPYYTPKLGAKSESNHSHRSSHHSQQSASSLQDIIEKNGVVIDDQTLAAATGGPTSSPQFTFAQMVTPGLMDTQLHKKQQPQIRRNSVVLGDIDLDAINEQQLQKKMTPPPAAVVGHSLISPTATMVPMNTPYTAGAVMMNPYIAHHQQQMMMANNPYMMINQQQMMMAQQQLQQQQQQQMNMNSNGNSRAQTIKIIKKEEENEEEEEDMDNHNALVMTQHMNVYEWLETIDLWRGGRVVVQKNQVTVSGAVCVVADIEINKRHKVGTFSWEIYVEKISNRCWIGVIPGPISSIAWKIGECPPTHPKSIGIENTYGFMYCGSTKCGSIGRAPRNRDHIRFKLDISNKILYGSLNDPNCDNIWYKGEDIPDIACIVIINSTGKGKFQIRH